MLLFLHGGGFREGDRKQYGYVGEPFAKHGIITVVASYRLTPGFTHPAQPDDTKAIVAWIHKNIAQLWRRSECDLYQRSLRGRDSDGRHRRRPRMDRRR